MLRAGDSQCHVRHCRLSPKLTQTGTRKPKEKVQKSQDGGRFALANILELVLFFQLATSRAVVSRTSTSDAWESAHAAKRWVGGQKWGSRCDSSR